MNEIKNLGVFMDHSSAQLIECNGEPMETKTIESEFTHAQKEETLAKSENLMHNKEQHMQAEYYKKLGEVIFNYQDVILFGPTSAKSELYNILKTDQRFKKINIEVKQADKMTENQQHAMVKEHFSKS